MPNPLYTYLVVDLVTEKVRNQYPFSGVSFGTTLNAIGSMKFTLPLDDAVIQASNWNLDTVEAMTGIYVLRGDQAVWGGIVWTRHYNSQTRMQDFQASTFESYFSHIPYGGTKTWTNHDQLSIVREMIADVSVFGHVMPMPVSTNMSGVLRDYQILGYEYKWLSEPLATLQQLPNGFDMNFDVYFIPGVGPRKQLNLLYPRAGVTLADTHLVFETSGTFPNNTGNIAWYEWPEDGTTFATDIIELGAGTGLARLIGTAGDVSLLRDGWPIMYQIISRIDVKDQSFLGAYALGDLALYRNPKTLPVFHMRGDYDPLPGTYKVGDDVKVRICDARFPQGVEGFLRIMATNFTVGDDGTEDIAVTCMPTIV